MFWSSEYRSRRPDLSFSRLFFPMIDYTPKCWKLFAALREADGQPTYPSCLLHPSPIVEAESKHYRMGVSRTWSAILFYLFQETQWSNSPQVWLWVEKFPTHGNQNLFAFDVDSTRLISLEIHPDGKLSFKSSAQQEPGAFPHATIAKARWTHITLVHYTHRSLNPTIRRYPPFISLELTKPCSGLFIDGVLCDGLNWPYPKNPTTAVSASYVIGDDTSDATMQWCLSTSYLISVPLGQ